MEKPAHAVQEEPEPDGLALDRSRQLVEQEFREREVAVKEREQQRLDEDLQFKKQEARRSRWSNPWVLAILGAIAAALGNVAIGWQSAKDQLLLETFRAESARLLEVVKTNNPDQAAVNLRFLVDVGLVSTPEIKAGVLEYLRKKKDGEGVSLPTPASTESPRRTDSPLFKIRSPNLPAGFTNQDEIAFMVQLFGRPGYSSGSLRQALDRWSPPTEHGEIASRIIADMRTHGAPDATLELPLDVNNRTLMRSLLWSLAHLESGSDLSDRELDSGIDQAIGKRGKAP